MTVKQLREMLVDYENDSTKVVIKCGDKFVDFKQGDSESLNDELEVDFEEGDCSIVLNPITD